MIQKKIRMLGVLSAMLCCGAVSAQQHEVEMIPFGNMDQWIDRQIKESGIIGGATKNVYAIGPTATVTETKAYKNMGDAPRPDRIPTAGPHSGWRNGGWHRCRRHGRR